MKAQCQGLPGNLHLPNVDFVASAKCGFSHTQQASAMLFPILLLLARRLVATCSYWLVRQLLQRRQPSYALL